MGMAVPLYLPTLMDERPDPRRDGGVIVDARFEPGPHLLDEHGRLSMGLLSTLVDNVGGMVYGIAVLPDWIVTTNLTAPTGGTASRTRRTRTARSPSWRECSGEGDRRRSARSTSPLGRPDAWPRG